MFVAEKVLLLLVISLTAYSGIQFLQAFADEAFLDFIYVPDLPRNRHDMYHVLAIGHQVSIPSNGHQDGKPF